VAAFDLTFSAPKSVSVLFAIAAEDVSAALLEAHERAVKAAFKYVEREACFTRRGHDGVRRVRGDGFVAAAYRHRLSRAGDPQLHTHVVVANMIRAEARWTTLEAHSLYAHKSAAGAVYRAVLRAEVRERLPWVWWREVGRGLFEIEGMPEAVLREFSRRRVEIEERALALTGVEASKLAYTSFSRARERTRVYVVAEATSRQREREEYSPPEPQRTTSEALDIMVSAMRRREAEPLAIEAPEGPELQAAGQTSSARVSLAELAEAGAQQAAADWELRRPSEIRGPGATRWRTTGRERGMER
jgi:conjugative relaxase-like TrwC/TraI family protein